MFTTTVPKHLSYSRKERRRTHYRCIACEQDERIRVRSICLLTFFIAPACIVDSLEATQCPVNAGKRSCIRRGERSRYIKASVGVKGRLGMSPQCWMKLIHKMSRTSYLEGCSMYCVKDRSRSEFSRLTQK